MATERYHDRICMYIRIFRFSSFCSFFFFGFLFLNAQIMRMYPFDCGKYVYEGRVESDVCDRAFSFVQTRKSVRVTHKDHGDHWGTERIEVSLIDIWKRSVERVRSRQSLRIGVVRRFIVENERGMCELHISNTDYLWATLVHKIISPTM